MSDTNYKAGGTNYKNRVTRKVLGEMWEILSLYQTAEGQHKMSPHCWLTKKKTQCIF